MHGCGVWGGERLSSARAAPRYLSMLTLLYLTYLLSVSKSLIKSSLYHTAEVLLARDKTASNLGCHFPIKLECMIRM